MQRFDTIIGELLFGLLAFIAIGATWLFGAWENWWFWPFTTLILGATACFALRLILSAQLGTARLNLTALVYTLVLAWLPFLIYALFRALPTRVPMDAERSFLLHLTPFLLALITALGLPESRRRLLALLVLVSLTLVALYGIANHLLADNVKVLWADGFPQYQQGGLRATGTYFCPDHFSGLMEIALALGLALALTNPVPTMQRIFALGLCGLACWGIILSRSRGGGIVAGVLMLAALWLATMSWDRRVRWWGRAVGLGLLTAGIAAFALAGGHYVKRFKAYPWTQLEHSDRYQMSAAALRAWRTAPWLGVGPGMHQNLWPHFAASSDGDREQGIWPTHPNNNYHSFEAHNDWAQLLEEYGLIGLVLFLIAIGTALWQLYQRWKRWARLFAHEETPYADSGLFWLLPGLLLAALAMVIHSMGDFNLQIPGTTWLLGILAGLTLAMAGHTPRYRPREGSSPGDQP